jgi:hypothetical protein
MSETFPAPVAKSVLHIGWRPVLIVLIFAFLGPIFGMLSLFAYAAISTLMIEPFSLDGMPSLARFIAGLLFLFGFSYLYGGIQAAITGIAAAWSYARNGRVCLKHVLFAAALCYAAVFGFAFSRLGQAFFGANIWFMVVPHLFAAFFCWLLVSSWRAKVGA